LLGSRKDFKRMAKIGALYLCRSPVAYFFGGGRVNGAMVFFLVTAGRPWEFP
jgi:hypothetical protein